MILFDSHAHLDDPELYNRLDEVIKNATAAGVKYIATVGQDVKTSKKAVEIARKYKNVYAIVGIHPNEVKNAQPGDLIEIAALLKDPKVVCVGEIGLDYHWDSSNKEEQKAYFITQIATAYKYGKPINIHARDAAKDTFDILKDNRDKIINCVLHCYSFSKELAREFVKLGFYISLGGPVTFKNAKEPKLVAQETPLARLFIETDSPSLSPEPKRGKINEPANVRYVCDVIASLKGITAEEVARQTTLNAKKVYGIED